MARKLKIAVSLAPEVVDLLDRHAKGRSRSQCVEEELLKALRGREWERLSSQRSPRENEDVVEWAAHAWAAVGEELWAQEGSTASRPDTRARGAARRRVR